MSSSLQSTTRPSSASFSTSCLLSATSLLHSLSTFYQAFGAMGLEKEKAGSWMVKSVAFAKGKISIVAVSATTLER